MHPDAIVKGMVIAVLRGPLELEPDPHGFKGVRAEVEDRTLVGQPLEVLSVSAPFVLVRRLGQRLAGPTKRHLKEMALFGFGEIVRVPSTPSVFILDLRQVSVTTLADEFCNQWIEATASPEELEAMKGARGQ